MNMTQDFIKSIIPEAEFKGIPLLTNCTWSVDSRSIIATDIFIALMGNNFDGHDFVENAFAQGAVGAMIAISQYDKFLSLFDRFKLTKTFIIVENPKASLIALAKAWRKLFTYPVIGITGSVGKTTTKKFLGNILDRSDIVHLVAHGNQNTAIGISLNILKMRQEHTCAIFEMGISKRGEMAELAAIVLPTIGIITFIGHSHMEGLGSIVDIASEKRDIFKYFPSDGIGIIDGDQPLLAAISYDHPMIKFGKKTSNQIQARKIQYLQDSVSFQLKLYQNRYSIVLPGGHVARIYNALAAVAVAHILNIPIDKICQGIQDDLVVQGRFHTFKISGTDSTIIDDSYNANPESMKAALLALEQIEGVGKKIAVIGDMLELGVNSSFWHRQIGRFLRKVPSLSQVIFVGDQVKWAQKVAPFTLSMHHVATWEQAVPLLRKFTSDEKLLILLKGSRNIGLNNIIKNLI